MSTPKQPKPNSGRILEPTKMAVTKFDPKRVYPDSNVDNFGHVNNSDKDRSRTGLDPNKADDNHAFSDVDAGTLSIHHTLGTGRNQASPGDHTHDGTTSRKLGLYEMDPGNPGQTRPALVLTGAKGGNVALTNLIAMLKTFIDFRDTTT